MKIKYFIASVFILFIATFGLYAQRGYTEFVTQDSIQVMYRWQKVSPFKKDSDAVLNLRATNLSDSAAKWTFTVVFYNDKMAIHESEITTLCLKPGQSLRGGLAGLRYTVEGMKLDAVDTDYFTWDFDLFEVEKVENCDEEEPEEE